MICLPLQLIHSYLEGELSPEERRNVEDHLAACPSCRGLVADRRAFLEASLSLPPVAVPPGFAKAVIARIPVIGASRSAWLAAILSTAGTALLLLASTFLLAGQSLPGLFSSANRSLWNALGVSAAVLGKALKIVLLGFKLAGEAAGGLAKILEFLSAFVLRPGTLVPALVLGSGLSFLFIFGMRRILSIGERS